MKNFEQNFQRMPDEPTGGKDTTQEKRENLGADTKKLFGHNLNKWFPHVSTEFRAKIIVALKNALKIRKEPDFVSPNGAHHIFDFIEPDKNNEIEQMVLNWAQLHIAMFPELTDDEANDLAAYLDTRNEEHTGTRVEEEWPSGTLKEFFYKKYGLSKHSGEFETYSRAGGSTSAEDFSVKISSEDAKNFRDTTEQHYLDMGYQVIGKDGEHIFLQKGDERTTVYFTRWDNPDKTEEVLVSVYPSHKDEHTWRKGF